MKNPCRKTNVTKQYLKYFANERPDILTDEVNAYLAMIEDKENPIQNVQIVGAELVNAYHRIWVLITEVDHE